MSASEKIGEAVIWLLTKLLIVAIYMSLGLLFAFPIKWTWNVAMPYLFGWPLITWGKAWCLWFLSCTLIKRMPEVDNKKKE